MNSKKTAVALGLFDGVHLGHRAVLRAAYEQKQNGLVPCVFTFPPESVLRKSGGNGGYIYTSDVKHRLFADSCGIADVVSPPFEDICGISGEEFAEAVLHRQLNAEFVCCGNDFRFGRKAACGVEELRDFGEKYGFEVRTVDNVCKADSVISSSEIRRLLLNGAIEQANLFLGEPYTIIREVSHGAQLGRTIGFPTINQLFGDGQLVPQYGVYASRTMADGKWYPSMTNIGVKPTVEYGGMPLAETYIHGYSGDLYGKTVKAVLLKFIRPERKFSSVEELKIQISADISAAVSII